MSDDLTHTVRVVVSGNYPHGSKEHAEVNVAGDGSLDHMIDTFKAALVAAGYSPAVADRLSLGEE